MGCSERLERGDGGYIGSLARSSHDYNLEELVRVLRLKHGGVGILTYTISTRKFLLHVPSFIYPRRSCSVLSAVQTSQNGQSTPQTSLNLWKRASYPTVLLYPWRVLYVHVYSFLTPLTSCTGPWWPAWMFLLIVRWIGWKVSQPGVEPGLLTNRVSQYASHTSIGWGWPESDSNVG